MSEMAHTYHAIPTTYAGVQFRSRVESRWAAFFDLLGWSWLYEPVDLDGYIPDFVLPFPAGDVLVEVKSAFSLSDLHQHTGKIDASGWAGDAVIVGSSLFQEDLCGEPALGLYGRVNPWGEPEEAGTTSRDWSDEALLIGCGWCRRPTFYGPDGAWKCAVGGVLHEAGLSYEATPEEISAAVAVCFGQRSWPHGDPDPSHPNKFWRGGATYQFESLWRTACNMVKWEPKDSR